MNHFRPTGRGAILPVLLAAAALAAFPRPSSAELPKYLPDGCNLIVAVNFAEVYDSSYYQKLKTDIADFARGEKGFTEEIGLAPSNLASVIMAGNAAATGREGQPIVVVKTRKPISAADLRAARTVRSYQKDFSYNEIKVGAQTIYEATYHFSFDQGKGELQHGEAFAVVEDNVVLFGSNGEALRKVLARGKAADLSPELASAAKDADFTKTLVFVFDLKALAADERFSSSFKRDFGPLFGDATNIEFLKKLNSLCLEGVLKGSDATFRASLTAKDAETAGDVKKVVGAAQIALRGTLQNATLPRVPKEVVDAIDAVKFSVEGAKVNASGAVKAEPVTQWIEDAYNDAKKQFDDRTKKLDSRLKAKPTETKPVEK
jgi:hypothetical protein